MAAIGPARMPILDHLGELRRRAVVILISLIATIVVLYFVSPWLTEFLKQPIAKFLPDGNLYTFGAFEGFALKLRVTVFFSFFVCSPLIFWEILAFFMPALKPNERKFVLPTFLVAVALYLFGMSFCYLFCLTPAFEWLTGESLTIAELMPQAQNYIHYVMLFLIAFGFAFELPLIVFFLVRFGIVPYKTLRKSWRYVYVILLIFSAIVTPDASPVTMGIMFGVLLALYEISMAIAKVGARKREERKAKEAIEDEDVLDD